jgi:hypothetical protein
MARTKKAVKKKTAKKQAEKKQEVVALPKKVFIVGCSNTKTEVPWDEVREGKAEAWGVNNLFLSMPLEKFPFTRFFEIHGITRDKRGNYLRREDPVFRGQPVNDYMKSLGALGIPVYMQKLWPDVPNGVVYPLEVIMSQFGDYFTNSISYQIALAVLEGFKEIHIYGVDMAVSSPKLLHDEYSHQRPSVEYFVGIAVGRGIKVHIPDTADLLKTRFLYGWDEPKMTKWEKKKQAMLKHIEHQQQNASFQKVEMQRKEDQAIGAKLAVIEMDKVWQ